ncbi:cerebellin-2-like isoform X2 [Rhinichthys klamathensis goyatoka]|uniref:cerebellin-2-like isoform X2 n=1 Tax=Rhinichthys klamathensis goyatoka TaxID=3034132 RepID=UPI0024B568B6|nr:cerebellin-2-like isoform X2 [Rhinichthys klamathensis goyatoka]
MKLVTSVVVLMCVGVAQTHDFMSPTLDIIGELHKIRTMEEKLNALHEEVRELKSKNEERVKVAFSASLPDSVGPFPEATTLLYKNTFINIGNAYDTITGIFTAPVKGVYFFIFVVFNAGEEATGVRLLKNDNFVVLASDNAPGHDSEDTTINSVSLLLERGDRIHLQLIEKRRIYTDSLKRNTFSGHLLFTV